MVTKKQSVTSFIKKLVCNYSKASFDIGTMTKFRICEEFEEEC